MNDANYAVLNYLTNEYGIKDVSIEGIENAIDDIFNFQNILPQYKSLFNILIIEAIDFEFLSEQLTTEKNNNLKDIY